MVNAQDGATPELQSEKNLAECMGRWAHSWMWVWENGKWTTKKRCTTCGVVQEAQRFKGQ